MAVYTRLTKKDAAWVAKAFRLGEVRAFEGIAKGSVNTNYRLETADGTFFVRLDETRTKAQVLAEQELVAWLASRGFPTPEALPDARGRRVLALRDKPVAVYPWVPGADKDAADYRLADLAEAGRVLAALHHAAAGFARILPNRFGQVATAARWARIRARARIPTSDRAEIDEAVASFSRRPPPAGARGVVHGDWFADNLLFEGDRIVSVLDFEAAATDDLGFDVATAINALCWLPSSPDTFDARRVSAFLEGYRKAPGAGGPEAPRRERAASPKGEQARTDGPAPAADATLRYWLRASALRFTVTRIQDFRLKKSALRVEKDYRDFLRRLRFWTAADIGVQPRKKPTRKKR